MKLLHALLISTGLLSVTGCVTSPFVAEDAALYNRGMALVQAEHDEEAAQTFRQLAQVNPKHPLAHYSLGVLYDDQGQFEEAIVEFQKALELDPNNVDAQYRLGVLYATQGMDAEAIESLNNVLKSQPNHSATHYNLAVLYEANDHQDQAIHHYRTVIEIDPKHAEALNNLGLIYAKRGMWDVAQERLESAILINPRYFQALNNLGIVLVEKRRFEKAAKIFERALNEKPKSAEVLYNLTKIHFEHTHDYLVAIRYARDYLDLGDSLHRKSEVEELLVAAGQKLAQMQGAAETSLESRIRRDAKDFILAVQRSDFRSFYDFQPGELQAMLTKEEWDKDMEQLNGAELKQQKEALTRLIGFDDLLSLDVKKITMVSPQKAKVFLVSRFATEEGQFEKGLYWEEVKGRWAPSEFLQRIRDNWNRAKVESP
jgi:Tfp pilus assembly protein PilF